MFQLNKQACDEWFKHLISKSPFSDAPQMDIYHMCFVVGTLSVLNNNNNDFVELEDPKAPFYSKGWPSEYRNNADSIIALLLESEIVRLDYDRNNKELIKSFVDSYLDTNSITKLSNEGINLMNRYSFNGYLKIKNTIKQPPTEPTTFLIQYQKIIEDLSR